MCQHTSKVFIVCTNAKTVEKVAAAVEKRFEDLYARCDRLDLRVGRCWKKLI